MQKNNTVFLADKELADVVVSSDARGRNSIMSALKYNRLVNGQGAASVFNKNTVLVRDTQLKDTLVVSDCHGNNTITTMKNETSDGDSGGGDSGNVFTEVLHRVQSQRNQASIDSYLEQKRQLLQDKLAMATQLYTARNYMKALEYYRHALTLIESDSYPDEFRLENGDIFRIKYALALSNIGMNLYGPLKTACEMLSTLILTYGGEYPSLYYSLGRAKVMLNLYESARIVLETGLAVLDECVVLSHLTFPASNQVIPDTEPCNLLDNLEETLDRSKNVPKADVKCCYRLCIADSKAIYFNGPSFIGYVNVTCSARCQYNYHRSCWKIKLKTDRVKKPSTILNQRCQTEGCGGLVAEIKIFDQRLKVNAAIRAKAGRDSSSSDNDRHSSSDNSCVVESRVYKAHFELPTPAAASSNLKPNAAIFTPGKLKNITLHLKNATKSGPRVFDSADASDQGVTTAGSVQRSRLKADVPEFRPTRTEQSDNGLVNLTKWSTNAESTLELVTDEASNEEPAVLDADASDWVAPTSFAHVPSEYSEVLAQPAVQDGGSRLKLTEDKAVWTEPVTTHAVTTQCHVQTSSEQTQTEADDCDNTELALLKCQIDTLKRALYRAEDLNNELLLRQKQLPKTPTVDSATQTDSVIDKRQKNCLKWIHNTCTPAICHADILHTTNQRLEDELKELKKLSRLEKDCFHESKTKYCGEIEALQCTVDDLDSQLEEVRAEYHEYKQNNTMLAVNKLLLEQIHCNKNFYLPYLKTFEDKCKHMIWELEDLQVLTTVGGTPGKVEVEESLGLWRAALADVESRQRIVMEHYETLLCNITRHQYTAVFQYPGLSLLVEPPNIMLRHFKPMLMVNRRLDQDIANQMQSFYKILSQSYTSVYPQQLAGADLQNNIDLAAQRTEGGGESDRSARPAAAAAAENGLACSAPVPKAKAPPPASATTPGPAPKINKTRQNRPPPEAPPAQQPKRPLQDIIGLDALIEKLQSQFPLTEGSVITEALFSVRGQHGGLSGMSSKEILAEVKKYLRVKQQKTCGTAAAPPAVSPWSTINTPVQWHSDEQDTSCTICFEKMAPSDSVMLRCQHVFHSQCIKIWLHSNSICPICRSFTTLDDEFPPLI